MFKGDVYTRLWVHVVDTKDRKAAHYVVATGVAGEYHVLSEADQGANGVACTHSVMTLAEIREAFGAQVEDLVRVNLGRRT